MLDMNGNSAVAEPPTETQDGQELSAVAQPPWDGLKWQYGQMIVSPTDPQVIGKECAQMGEQGWELCSMLPVNMPGPAQMNQLTGQIMQGLVPGVILMFKRPKARQVEA